MMPYFYKKWSVEPVVNLNLTTIVAPSVISTHKTDIFIAAFILT